MEHPTRGLNGTAIKTIMLTLCLVLMAILPSLAVGYSQSANQYTTIVLTEQKSCKVGDEATIEVRFYDKDALTDPTDINLTVGSYMSERHIEVDKGTAKESKGVYRVPITIKEDDLDYWGDSVSGSVRCNGSESRSEMSDTANFELEIEEEDDEEEETDSFVVDVTVDKSMPKPGDTVRFTVTCTNNSQKVDPDDIQAVLYSHEETEDVTGDLVNDTKGQKHYDYTVPANATKNQLIGFGVEADYGDAYASGEAYAVMNFYQIWLHVKTLTATAMTGEIGVCDMDGAAVQADIYLVYEYEDESWENVRKEKTGQTGANGLMDITMNYADIDEYEWDVDVEIWANGTGTRAGQYQQYAEDYLDLPETDDDYIPDDEFYIMPKDDENVPAGEKVTVNYQAYSNGTPLANKVIYYYFFDDTGYYGDDESATGKMGKVHHVGKSTTDSNGSFSVTLDTPDEETSLETMFKADFGGTRNGEGEWRVTSEDLDIGDEQDFDDDISISVSGFEFGKKATVTVSRPGLSDARASLMILTIDPSIKNIEDYDGDDGADSWKEMSSGLDMEAFQPFTGDSFSREIGIPAFFPEDKNFLIVAYILGRDATTGDMTYHLNYIVVNKDGKVQKMDGDGDDDDDDPGFGALLMVSSVVLAAVFISRRRRR